jgi:hypothetical protein
MARDVEAGTPVLIPLGGLEWFDVEDASVLKVERMPAGELMLMGTKPGRSLVLLYGDGKMAVWLVRVGGKPVADAAAVEAAKKACPGLKLAADDDPQLLARINDEKCRLVLLALLKNDGFVSGKLELIFELGALQAQLKALSGAFAVASKEVVTARYVGAGMELSGKLTTLDHRRVLWALFRHSVGRVALTDKVELLDADAGSGQP